VGSSSQSPSPGLHRNEIGSLLRRSVSTPSATQPTPSESVPPPARGTLVTTADSQFGEILFDDTGQAIYLFDKEQTTSPELL
jgi:hypothetical protein